MVTEDELHETWKGIEKAWIELGSPRRPIGIRKVKVYSEILFEFFNEFAKRPVSEMELFGRGSDTHDRQMTRIGMGALRVYFGVDKSASNPNLLVRGLLSAIDDSNFGWSAVECGTYRFRFFEPTNFAQKSDSFHFVRRDARAFEVNQGYR